MDIFHFALHGLAVLVLKGPPLVREAGQPLLAAILLSLILLLLPTLNNPLFSPKLLLLLLFLLILYNEIVDAAPLCEEGLHFNRLLELRSVCFVKGKGKGRQAGKVNAMLLFMCWRFCVQLVVVKLQ